MRQEYRELCHNCRLIYKTSPILKSIIKTSIQETEQVFLRRIRKVPDSSFRLDIGYSNVCCGFPQSLRANSEIVPQPTIVSLRIAFSSSFFSRIIFRQVQYDSIVNKR